MRPGDYLFLRDPKVSTDPSKDVLAVMVTGEYVSSRLFLTSIADISLQ